MLQPNSKPISTQCESLYFIEEVTELALALNRFASVSSSSGAPNAPNEILDRSQQFSSGILSSILAKFDGNGDDRFENEPSRGRLGGSFGAFLNQGPPNLGPYYILYGLLDCASRLARILPPTMLEPEFKERMMRIICQSKESSYQWKAVSAIFVTLAG
jgi:hypothetical protein